MKRTANRMLVFLAMGCAITACDERRSMVLDGSQPRDTGMFDASHSSDASEPPPACAPACGPDEVCADGICTPLPSQCPCPLGSYCDLATDTCRAGCATDEHCTAGLYCDVGARSCQPGCRVDDDCPALEDLCDEHACVNHCSCDDRDPCTTDSCLRGACAHEPGNEGGACADDGSICTRDVCRAGECSHAPTNEGDRCESSACERDTTCQSGACRGTAVQAGAFCGNGFRHVCIDDLYDGAYCADISAYCSDWYYGSGWSSGFSSNFCVGTNCTTDTDSANCRCSSGELSGAGRSVSCSNCQYAGRQDYSGGYNSPDGYTAFRYVCLD